MHTPDLLVADEFPQFRDRLGRLPGRQWHRSPVERCQWGWGWRWRCLPRLSGLRPKFREKPPCRLDPGKLGQPWQGR